MPFNEFINRIYELVLLNYLLLAVSTSSFTISSFIITILKFFISLVAHFDPLKMTNRNFIS